MENAKQPLWVRGDRGHWPATPPRQADAPGDAHLTRSSGRRADRGRGLRLSRDAVPLSSHMKPHHNVRQRPILIERSFTGSFAGPRPRPGPGAACR